MGKPELIPVEEYLKLSKEEKQKLYREYDEKYGDPNKKVILPCQWTTSDENRQLAERIGVKPMQCQHFDCALFRCLDFMNGWLDCEEILLKLRQGKGVKHD